jgi:putative protease
VQADNLGVLTLAKALGFIVHGGLGLNILNTTALDEYDKLGLCDATVSFELSRQRIRVLGGKLPRGAVVYGRLPLMRFRTCPKNDCAHCDGRAVLTDRMGIEFPLVCTEKQYQTLYNSRPLWVADKGDFAIDFMTLYFTDEEDVQPIIEDCLDGLPSPVEHTNGLYLKEII